MNKIFGQHVQVEIRQKHRKYSTLAAGLGQVLVILRQHVAIGWTLHLAEVVKLTLAGLDFHEAAVSMFGGDVIKFRNRLEAQVIVRVD